MLASVTSYRKDYVVAFDILRPPPAFLPLSSVGIPGFHYVPCPGVAQFEPDLSFGLWGFPKFGGVFQGQDFAFVDNWLTENELQNILH